MYKYILMGGVYYGYVGFILGKNSWFYFGKLLVMFYKIEYVIIIWFSICNFKY